MKDKITISQIAKMAGVSKATISFYLNGNTKKMSSVTYEKIKKVIEETGYQPSVAARSLNSKDSHLLGVIIGDITIDFANRIIKGIEDVARENNYLTIVASSGFNPDKEEELVKSMLAMGVDGFIVQPSMEFDSMWKNNHFDKPLVYFDSPTLIGEQNYVKTNNYEIVYDVTNKLIDRGYEHFVLLTHNPYVMKTRFDRNRGCISALEERNIDYDTIVVNSDNDLELLSNKLHPIVEKHKNIAIISFNTKILETAYMSMHKYVNRCPELALIGFGHVSWCDFVKPSISTIKQPVYEEGYKAGEMIIDILNGKEDINKQIILPSIFLEKDSTNRKN